MINAETRYTLSSKLEGNVKLNECIAINVSDSW
jgi:hypothetical protein